MSIPGPYLVFLGDVNDPGYAKTAYGLAQWCPDRCLGQLRFEGCPIDLGLPDMDIAQAAAEGAKTLIIGVAPVGGAIQNNWLDSFFAAIESGLSVAAGLHTKLRDNQQLLQAAQQYDVALIDVRTPPDDLPIATGKKRTGKRLLTVGTDCAVGKKYAALSIAKGLKERGINCTFRATGQTGIMIAGDGIPIDAVVSDFIAGAAEHLTPDNTYDHWDIIEGQGSLFHPAYAGVSLGLLHGAQPDAIVICHDPSRSHLLGFPEYPVPSIAACLERTITLASLTNPQVRCIGICVNTSGMQDAYSTELLQQISSETGLPAIDPLQDNLTPLLKQLSP